LQKLDAILNNRQQSAHMTPPIKPTKEPVLSIPPKENISIVDQFSLVVNLIAKDKPSLASHLRLARPHLDKSSKVLFLYFEQSLHYEEVLLHILDPLLKGAIKTVFREDYSLMPKLNKTTSPAVPVNTIAEADAIKAKNTQDAMVKKATSDPLVQKVLEIFGGEITDVKLHISNIG
jgi:hypothetical protein